MWGGSPAGNAAATVTAGVAKSPARAGATTADEAARTQGGTTAGEDNIFIFDLNSFWYMRAGLTRTVTQILNSALPMFEAVALAALDLDLLGRKAGCSITSAKSCVPRRQLVSGRCPRGALVSYRNSSGHLR